MTEQERKIIDQAHEINNITDALVTIYVKIRQERNREHDNYLYQLSKAKMYDEGSEDWCWCWESGKYSAGREQGYRDVIKMLENVFYDMKERKNML